MTTLRRWQLEAVSPHLLKLAADARISQTDYADDQVWELALGSGEMPALQLQTRYGGRAGLASLVPMWLHDGRPIYQAQAYAKPPYVTGFAPGYLRVQATLTEQLALLAEYWVIDSHSLAVQFTLANAHVAATEVRLDVLGFVGIGGKEQRLSILALPDSSTALGLGTVGNLHPVVLLEGAHAEADEPSGYVSPKIGRTFTIEGRKKITLRLVHVGLPSVQASVATAQKHLQSDWGTTIKRIAQAAGAIPDIETGNAELDKAIAFSYRELVSSFLKATASLPHASFVATRNSDHGYSLRGDGSDHNRGWAGQSGTLAYMTALGIAPIAPALAQGVIRNYIAIQEADGFIDARPGLGGQTADAMCPPLLARLAWGIFQYTEDAQFLRDVFPGLLKFFDRWTKADADGDGMPEWQSETQTGYLYRPTFATGQSWAQGADIRLVEAPDLAAYLLSEARSLKEIAYYLHNTAAEEHLRAQIERLQTSLDALWNSNEQHYRYRDRDSHLTPTAQIIIQDARGGDELLPAEALATPNRILVRVTGGRDLMPKLTLKLDGLDAAGSPISETASSDQFAWSTGQGVYTSQQVYSQIDRVQIEGLSRAYRVDVQTIDLTRQDLHTLLPLWAGLPPERAQALLARLTHDDFWRANGVTINPASDANFDPSNADGSGGVWPYFLTLMGEALVEMGEAQKAGELLMRCMTAQAKVMSELGQFSEFYHSDEPKGLGEHGHLAGIVPVYLLLRALGVRVISPKKVWVGGAYPWQQPMTIRQHGVTVVRSAAGARITFPSGHSTTTTGSEWQEAVDRNV
jgi:hypothetical protein